MILDTPLLFDDENHDKWLLLGYTIEQQEYEKSPEITINVCGGGGKLWMLGEFINSIQKAQQKGIHVIASIIDEAFSAHAYLTVFCDEVKIHPSSFLLFHQAFVQKALFFNLIKYKSFDILDSEKLFQEIIFYKAENIELLAKEDIEIIKNGGEVKVTNSEKIQRTKRFRLF
jgi:hypothetical protein